MQRAPRARAIDGHQSAGCGTLTVEPAFDFNRVGIQNCLMTPDNVAPGERVTVQATVTNDNPVRIRADVTWFASDLPSGPGVGPESVEVPANGSSTVTLSFRPDEVPEFSQFVQDGFSSVVNARILPGSIEQAAPMRADGGVGGHEVTVVEGSAPTAHGCGCGGSKPRTTNPLRAALSRN